MAVIYNVGAKTHNSMKMTNSTRKDRTLVRDESYLQVMFPWQTPPAPLRPVPHLPAKFHEVWSSSRMRKERALTLHLSQRQPEPSLHRSVLTASWNSKAGINSPVKNRLWKMQFAQSPRARRSQRSDWNSLLLTFKSLHFLYHILKTKSTLQVFTSLIFSTRISGRERDQQQECNIPIWNICLKVRIYFFFLLEKWHSRHLSTL